MNSRRTETSQQMRNRYNRSSCASRSSLIGSSVVLNLICCSIYGGSCRAFQVVVPPSAGALARSRRCGWNGDASNTRLRFSSVGGGGPPEPPPPDDGSGGGQGEWDDFLDPNYKESENLQRAREYMSENSLPISFGEEEEGDEEGGSIEAEANGNSPEVDSSALVGPNSAGGLFRAPSEEILARNPYMAVVSRLTPSELISKFTSNAHPRVQNAVRSTILSLIGGLPKMAFDTTTITTGQRLASLMFQLQMTGYMFKNAEYRLSLKQSLGVDAVSPDGASTRLLTGSVDSDTSDEIDPLAGKVKGKLRIRYGRPHPPSEEMDAGGDGGSDGGKDKQQEEDDEADFLAGVGEMEVDAAAYMSELRSEVSQLRDELMISRKETEEALRKDLLAYIRTLPEQELRSLTNTMSQDVLVAMKGLVNAVMAGIGEGEIGPDTVTEQSGEAMAQLCMWQLVIGYNLRTLEVREEMKKSLTNGFREDLSASPPAPEDGVFE